MPVVPKTYNRNLRAPKFYSTAIEGRYGYNPTIIEYYNSNNELLKVEEIWRGKKYSQTISGSNYANQIVNYTITYQAWEETTVS